MIEQIYSKEENPEAYLAWQCVCDTHVNIFLTGKAGTGKTTFLKNLRARCPKRMVVVAPTGVAAINAGGVTIHSFFQLPFSPYIPGTKMGKDFSMRKEKIKILRTLDLLVIDEISMVRADLLDSLDMVLRKYRRSSRPFGGVQLLMIGDLQQLAPVVTDDVRDMLISHYDNLYFFGSKALADTMYATIELKKIYRQNEKYFVDMLNQVRNNQINTSLLEALNSRYIEGFNPSDKEGYIRLTTHNNKADKINTEKLSLLKGKEMKYVCIVDGTFPETSYPADKELKLKEGAQVMFLKNDTQPIKRYYNGKIGKVLSMSKDMVLVDCEGETVEVLPEKWSNTRYVLDKTTNEISEIEDGSFTQIPLRLAWAITIHKSQGLTFDKAIIDAQMSFSHGQVYVALSRCRSLEGVVLDSKLSFRSFVNDSSVVAFIDEQRHRAMTDSNVEQMRQEYALLLITELFSFTSITSECYKMIRLLEEHLHRLFPKLIDSLQQKMVDVENSIVAVGDRFCQFSESQLKAGVDIRNDREYNERLKNGAKYYVTKLLSYIKPIIDETHISMDNKELKIRFDGYREILDNEYKIKLKLFEVVSRDGFTVDGYIKARTEAILQADNNADKVVKKSTGKHSNRNEVEHSKLYDIIQSWTRDYADDNDIAETYKVMRSDSIKMICEKLPTTIKALKEIKGIGAKKIAMFGKDVVQIVRDYCDENDIVY